jgi:plastocyanin
MKRREFVEKVGVGSAGIVAAATLGFGSKRTAAQHVHDSTQVDGPLANASVSFGQWLTEPPIDRFATGGNTRTQNQHKVIPYNVTIKAGGSVSFIISGLHLLLVYGPGTTMESIDSSLVEFAVPNVFPGFINDPTNRIYRGLDPRAPAPLDRVEVVTFAEPGRYLVVCGILSHFQANMSGWVNVIR